MDRLVCGDVGFGKTEIRYESCFYSHLWWLSSSNDLSKSSYWLISTLKLLEKDLIILIIIYSKISRLENYGKKKN